MSENEEIEPAQADRTPVRAPKLICEEKEARQILEEVGMGVLDRSDREVDTESKSRPPGLSDLLKLGAFVEGSGVVPLDHGAILMTRQVMLRQMLRLEAKAQDLALFADLKDITYAMGFLGDKIGKLSMIGIKTKVAAEEAAEELRKKKQPSWDAGAGVGMAVQMQPGAVAHFHGTPNGVAGEAPP